MALTRINNNISAINANRNLVQTGNALRVSLERLSSGLAINRAADNAAGLTISENLRSQINGLNQSIDNASDAINLVNTAEGALIETTNRLQKIRTLAVQAANTGTNDSVARQAIQDEIGASISEITRIGNDTQFATKRLLNGDNANSVAFVDGGTTGLSLSNSPTASTLSSGRRFLNINRSQLGTETLAAGIDGVNNSGATTFTGSTFDTGTYDLSVTNVRAAAARVVQADLAITIAGAPAGAAADLNNTGTFTNSTTGATFAIDTADEVTFSGLASDGTAYTTTITSGGGGLSATGIETAIQTALTAAGAGDTVAYDAATGTFSLTAGSTGETQLSVGATIDDEGGGGAPEFATGEVVTTAGNDNDAIFSLAGGAAIQADAASTITLLGIPPNNGVDPQPRITLTVGATLTADGVDSLTIVQEQFTGSLEGGQSVTFQNGDSNVQFRSGTGGGFASGETVRLNFDPVVSITAGLNQARTFTLSSTNNSLNFQVGANQGQRVDVAIGDLRANQLGFVGETQPSGNGRVVSEINITTLTGANEAIAIVDEAINQVDQQRSALGAFTNRLEATIANLGVAVENLTASESRIRDADIALETTKFTRNQILLQAGISILGQANLAPQNVLALLT